MSACCWSARPVQGLWLLHRRCRCIANCNTHKLVLTIYAHLIPCNTHFSDVSVLLACKACPRPLAPSSPIPSWFKLEHDIFISTPCCTRKTQQQTNNSPQVRQCRIIASEPFQSILQLAHSSSGGIADRIKEEDENNNHNDEDKQEQEHKKKGKMKKNK